LGCTGRRGWTRQRLGSGENHPKPGFSGCRAGIARRGPRRRARRSEWVFVFRAPGPGPAGLSRGGGPGGGTERFHGGDRFSVVE